MRNRVPGHAFQNPDRYRYEHCFVIHCSNEFHISKRDNRIGGNLSDERLSGNTESYIERFIPQDSLERTYYHCFLKQLGWNPPSSGSDERSGEPFALRLCLHGNILSSREYGYGTLLLRAIPYCDGEYRKRAQRKDYQDFPVSGSRSDVYGDFSMCRHRGRGLHIHDR